MFQESRLFRLVIDEVEKTLALVDLDIARDYASLFPDEAAREAIFRMVDKEYALTREMVLTITKERDIALRFPRYRAFIASRFDTINQVNREQAELLRRVRASPEGAEKEAHKANLLLSINCIASGLGFTG
jgi:phosphoenolpyruvate carboxylase